MGGGWETGTDLILEFPNFTLKLEPEVTKKKIHRTTQHWKFSSIQQSSKGILKSNYYNPDHLFGEAFKVLVFFGQI